MLEFKDIFRVITST